MSDGASTQDQHGNAASAPNISSTRIAGIGAKRGSLWVLIAASCFAVVAAASIHTWQLVAILRVEQKLHHAAEVAAREATLPKASRSSVEQVAVGRLRRDGLRSGRRDVMVEYGRGLSRRQFHAAPDDCIAVTISLPTSAVLSAPLVRWSTIFGPKCVQATAERSL